MNNNTSSKKDSSGFTYNHKYADIARLSILYLCSLGFIGTAWSTVFILTNSKMAEDGENPAQQFVVMPEDDEVVDVETCLQQLIEFVVAKTEECKENVKTTSAVSFMANYLQNKQLCTELSSQMSKLYKTVDVKSEEAYDNKLNELSSQSDELAGLIAQLKEALAKWEAFLESVDKTVEEVAGPNSPKSVESIKLATKSKNVGQGTLLAYVQNSPYSMMFIEVVLSFNSSQCAEHVLKMYEKLADFQALDCDILLLTKSSGGEGGGFLKLVGVPFRLLLDEEQSLARILQNRQSAVSISGQKAIHLLAEISSSDKLVDNADNFGTQGGLILVDNSGNILYQMACNKEADWPPVDKLLDTVKQHTKVVSTARDGKKSDKENANNNVTVARKKCCVIL